MSALTLPTLLVVLLQPVGGPSSAPASAPGGSSGAPAPATAAPPTAPPAPPAKGPPPEVDLKCAPEPVRVGEPLICTLTAIHPENVSITVPLPAGAAETVETQRPAATVSSTQKRPDGRLETVRRFQVTPQDPKVTVKVPAVTVVYHEATGGEGKVEVPGRKVAIKRLLESAQDPQFRTFKQSGPEAPSGPPSGPSSAGALPTPGVAFLEAHGPVPFVTTNWPALIATIVLGGGLLGTLLTVLIMRFLAARRRVEAPWVDPRPAHVIALAALDALQGEHLPQQGRMKEFYFRLSEIVRAYLERRYLFQALEMTSDEIRAAFRPIVRARVVQSLQGRGLSETEHAPLLAERMAHEPALVAVEDFLAETDWVKFADFAPGESGAETAMRAARGIVELTREIEAQAPVAGGPQTPAGAT